MAKHRWTVIVVPHGAGSSKSVAVSATVAKLAGGRGVRGRRVGARRLRDGLLARRPRHPQQPARASEPGPRPGDRPPRRSRRDPVRHPGADLPPRPTRSASWPASSRSIRTCAARASAAPRGRGPSARSCCSEGGANGRQRLRGARVARRADPPGQPARDVLQAGVGQPPARRCSASPRCRPSCRRAASSAAGSRRSATIPSCTRTGRTRASTSRRRTAPRSSPRRRAASSRSAGRTATA